MPRSEYFPSLFFSNPILSSYIENLNAVWMDRLIGESRVSRFSTADLNLDWKEYYTLDTVSKTTRL